MKLMLARLSPDWQTRWSHPIALVETFVDEQLFQGTAYKVSGWLKIGPTAGFGRHGDGVGQDYYLAHGRPKQLWVKELGKGACQKLRAATLPAPWAAVEEQAAPRCRAPVPQIRSLLVHLQGVPEFRRRQSLAYPLAGLLALVAMATLCGVVRGQRDLAAFARTLSQGQLRALRFRQDRHTRRIRCPDETTFYRVLTGVDEALVEQVLLAWQEQLLGPAKDRAICVDGKKLRHARGVELVSALGAQSGRWLGTVCTEAKSNEIPAARALLKKVDVVGKTVVADALHTQWETAQQILFEHGGDFVFTVKENQKTLHTTVAGLLTEQPFSPSAHAAEPHLPAGNRSRREIRALQSQETTPEAVCFPGAQQIAKLRRRVRRRGKVTTETVYLLSSRAPDSLPASELAALKRQYWSIESALHYRLDEVLDEDRSRVRTPKAAHVLGMFRRLAVSLTIPWLAQKKQTRRRASTRDFHEHLRASNARRAHLLVTAAAPTSWLP